MKADIILFKIEGNGTTLEAFGYRFTYNDFYCTSKCLYGERRFCENALKRMVKRLGLKLHKIEEKKSIVERESFSWPALI